MILSICLFFQVVQLTDLVNKAVVTVVVYCPAVSQGILILATAFEDMICSMEMTDKYDMFVNRYTTLRSGIPIQTALGRFLKNNAILRLSY